ncbi:sugar ABC transporter ATP-binding protein [Lachnospiraceae bacterium]|uniref:sugar ABC transporter ATP-binding protein n=1 Tax=Extibacter sp. GGCC_0201 TaxID=2731209 RepID=UPI001AA16367|nr:sugar ABC transporter ATP-binding protein [Extibacter sp. GGCC_0201]MBO1722221.1 sugar ABC transporter ATP-binding protein [Extibacter sp. GGCC_0201]BDF35366.1 sugar ABC transporter ATP-binding protein [Lachnospiraceae bacterium]BDF39368.1 sugar ABC transporter ATP-binding protein [Lachnospiraceae bacterium]
MKVLEAQNITKLFPGVVALDSVDVSFDTGEIHCVIGENGAGKSTLIKCLTGVYEPEEGQVLIDGEDALKNKVLFDKVAYVPQEIDLFGYMSVAENLFLPYEKSGLKGIVNQKELEKKAVPLLEKFRIPVKPDELVKDISVSAQQLLQIARATVHEDYEVLMLDEPTTSLTTSDTEILFDIVKEIKAENKAIIFISHKLEEIFALGDVLTVFRNGKKVAYSRLEEIDIPWVIRQMTGRELDQKQVFYSDKVSDEVLLEVKCLTGERFTDVSFTLKKGEILGFSGLVGAGRSELMQAIFGYLPVYSGSVKLGGEEWKLGDTNYSVNHGFIYLPEERKKQGILPVLSIRENISVSALKDLKGGLGISKKKEDELAGRIIDTYDVKTPDAEKEIQFLSGGNQQKVIIGRSMCCSPKVLVFDEPTKGIDVGTKAEIYRLMKELAEEKGIGIILISSEMEEIKKCSNRIIALYEGKKAGEYDAEADKEAILSAIIGVNS